MEISKSARKHLEVLKSEQSSMNEQLERVKIYEKKLRLQYLNHEIDWEKLYATEKNVEKLSRKIENIELMTSAIEGKPLYANEILYTDINPYEVVEWKTPKLMVVRSMNATITEQAKKDLQDSFIPGGFVGHFDNDCQQWTYESDPKGTTLMIRRHKNGLWYTSGGTRFDISNYPYKYYDYNF